MRDSNGRFTHGNPGRPAGTPNKINSDLRAKFDELLESVSLDSLKADLQELEPEKRLNIIVKLAEYFLPKYQRSEISADIQSQRLDLFADYSKEDLFEFVHGRKPEEDDF